MRKFFAQRRLGIATRHLAWVALGFFSMLVLLAMVLARVGANRLLDATRWYGTLESSSQRIGWDGRITLLDARFVPYGADRSGELKAERLTVNTSGPLWLMRLALRRNSAERMERRRKELEESGALQKDDVPPVLSSLGNLVIEAENVTMGHDAAVARWVPWLDPSSGVLFASLGCREPTGLSLAVAHRAGDAGRFDVSLKLKQRRDAATVDATFVLGGISTASWRGQFASDPDAGLLAGDWRQWQLLEQRWSLRDRQFVRARNRECARRLAIPRPQFVARHALAVKRQLATWKIALPAPLEHAYREHASVGGDIVFVSRPKHPLRLGEYQLMSRSQRVGALDGQVIVAGRRLPLLLEFLPEAEAIAVVAATLDDSAMDDDDLGFAAAMPAKIGAAAPDPASPGKVVARVAKASGSDAAAVPAPVIVARQPQPRTEVAAIMPPTPTPPASPPAPTPSIAPARAAAPAPTDSVAVAASSSGAAAPASSRGMPPPTPAKVPGPETSSATPATASLPSQGNYAGLLGQRVTITTTYGTARTGMIRIANKVAVTLEMQTERGPIQLRIPAEQIVRVRTAPL